MEEFLEVISVTSYDFILLMKLKLKEEKEVFDGGSPAGIRRFSTLRDFCKKENGAYA